MSGEPENEFSLTRAAHSPCARITRNRLSVYTAPLVVIGAVVLAFTGCGQQSRGWDTAKGVVIQEPGRRSFRDQIMAATSAATPRAMQGTGLAGAMGGIQVKILTPGPHDLLLPLPQLMDCQAPVAYAVSCTPGATVGQASRLSSPGTGETPVLLLEARLQEQAEGNVFVNLKLKGEPGQEVKISWSSVVLIGSQPFVPNPARPEDYLPATACAQSGAGPVKELADKLWPANGKPEQYAKELQEFIRGMKQKEPPRSMDALGILKSGANWICTANANLAAALMRARHLPCRSLAVIPPNSRRLEMHRVVEYFDQGKWLSFDPSSLQGDIPLKPWQSIIVAKTTIPDEQRSMQPRMCSALGCPFAQEVEFADTGMTLSGNEFYWSVATPLAEFDVSPEAAQLTVARWNRFLKTGVLPDAQVKAAGATNLDQYISALKALSAISTNG